MTNQEAFSRVVLHLRKQGEPAMDGEVCKYRSEQGTRCAIGALLTDAEYLPEMENNSIRTISHDYKLPSLDGLDIEFLVRLQRIHDDPLKGANWVADMEDKARKFARGYDLTMPPC